MTRPNIAAARHWFVGCCLGIILVGLVFPINGVTGKPQPVQGFIVLSTGQPDPVSSLSEQNLLYVFCQLFSAESCCRERYSIWSHPESLPTSQPFATLYFKESLLIEYLSLADTRHECG
jgi:hypothetical protein